MTKKPVINKVTGLTYSSIAEAQRVSGLNIHQFGKALLKGDVWYCEQLCRNPKITKSHYQLMIKRIDSHGKVTIYKNAIEAAKDTGTTSFRVSACCNKQRSNIRIKTAVNSFVEYQFEYTKRV